MTIGTCEHNNYYDSCPDCKGELEEGVTYTSTWEPCYHTDAIWITVKFLWLRLRRVCCLKCHTVLTEKEIKQLWKINKIKA